MNRFIRKASVLALLFSGLFLLINFIVAGILEIKPCSLAYYFAQAFGMVILGGLLLQKKIQVY
jgi:hypothetical protein